jgi:hypothetical protein
MALNTFQKAVSDLAHSLGLKGEAEKQVYNTPQYQDLIKRLYGDIALPAGITDAMVTNRSAGSLSYTDPEGYIHQLMRNLNGLDPRLGSVSEISTNRPAVLPASSQEKSAVNDLLPQLVNLFKTPVGLSQIDPQTQALLAMMKQAEDQALQEQFDRESATSVARLVDQGVGSSSIAGNLINQLLQGQGLVRSQAQGQQAQRQLGIQQFLTQGQQTQNQDMQSFVLNLLNQALNRDVSGAQIGVQEKQIGNQNEQFYQTLQEQIRQFNEQQRAAERQSLFNNIFKGIAAGTSIASGGLVPGIKSLFSGVGGGSNRNVLTNPINPYATTNPYAGIPA